MGINTSINQEAIGAIASTEPSRLSIVGTRLLHDAVAAVIHVRWFLSPVVVCGNQNFGFEPNQILFHL